jgi:hypothetical protein
MNTNNSPPLDRRCDLCGAMQDEIIGFMKNDEELYPIRAGWVCWDCWPKEGSWHKAILRERTVSTRGDLEKQG